MFSGDLGLLPPPPPAGPAMHNALPPQMQASQAQLGTAGAVAAGVAQVVANTQTLHGGAQLPAVGGSRGRLASVFVPVTQVD